MLAVRSLRELVIGLTPLERPDVGLVVALCRAGALGVLDLGRDRETASRALVAAARIVRELGVRVPDTAMLANVGLPPQVTTVVVTTASDVARVLALGPRRV